MKALAEGKRTGTMFQILTLVAVVLLGGVGLWLVLDARSDAESARTQTERVRETLANVQQTLVSRCEQRTTFDTRQIAVDRVLKSYYDDLLPNIRENAVDDAFYQRLTERVVKVRDKLDDLLNGGIISNCQELAKVASYATTETLPDQS